MAEFNTKLDQTHTQKKKKKKKKYRTEFTELIYKEFGQ